MSRNRTRTHLASLALFTGLVAVPLFAEEGGVTPPVDPLDGQSSQVQEVPVGLSPVDAGLSVQAARDIELAICIDTSGSMDGLIESAKQRLWALVNDLAVAEPTPRLRVALLTYGSPVFGEESGYVAVQVPLTEDLDLVSMKLFELGTNGGDEYVARVTDVATRQLSWSSDPSAVKMIVVAGNEGAEQDPKLTLEQACGEAIARGIVVSSLYCRQGGGQQVAQAANSVPAGQTVGSAAPATAGPAPGPLFVPLDEIALGWKKVATLSDGAFAMIDQDSGVVVMETPFDDELVKLSGAINGTYIPYGESGAWSCSNQIAQDANAVGLNNEAAASRAMTKGGGLYVCSWDLVDALDNEEVALVDVDRSLLAEDLRELDDAALLAIVDTKRAERAKISKRIAEVGLERTAYLETQRAELGIDESKSFDSPIRLALRELAEARGLRFPAAKVAATPTEAAAATEETPAGLGPVTGLVDGCYPAPGGVARASRAGGRRALASWPAWLEPGDHAVEREHAGGGLGRRAGCDRDVDEGDRLGAAVDHQAAAEDRRGDRVRAQVGVLQTRLGDRHRDAGEARGEVLGDREDREVGQAAGHDVERVELVGEGVLVRKDDRARVHEGQRDQLAGRVEGAGHVPDLHRATEGCGVGPGQGQGPEALLVPGGGDAAGGAAAGAAASRRGEEGKGEGEVLEHGGGLAEPRDVEMGQGVRQGLPMGGALGTCRMGQAPPAADSLRLARDLDQVACGVGDPEHREGRAVAHGLPDQLGARSLELGPQLEHRIRQQHHRGLGRGHVAGMLQRPLRAPGLDVQLEVPEPEHLAGRHLALDDEAEQPTVEAEGRLEVVHVDRNQPEPRGLEACLWIVHAG
ncbi:MAG: VWA domain-containing protein [Planctomycetota bacterium]|nr:VWA domain-containing protein [Planctomycetota bacterium]